MKVKIGIVGYGYFSQDFVELFHLHPDVEKLYVAELYPEGLPECIKGTEGIAQQYLFHWRRNI